MNYATEGLRVQQTDAERFEIHAFGRRYELFNSGEGWLLRGHYSTAPALCRYRFRRPNGATWKPRYRARARAADDLGQRGEI